jgi:hypothetical protein
MTHTDTYYPHQYYTLGSLKSEVHLQRYCVLEFTINAVPLFILEKV